jgi:SAM-dependent methyltransferase
MTSSEVSDHYREQYRESFQESRGERIGLNEADASFVRRQLGHGDGRRVLEVGCYTGYFLNHLKNHGWIVEGIEPNPDSATEARESFGFTVHETMLEKFEPDRRFDLIFAGSVLEHVREPTKSLLKMNQILRENGHLVIRVPNVLELELQTIADIFHIDHPHMFSPNALEMLLRKTGFQKTAMRSHEQFQRQLICSAKKVEESANPLTFKIENHHDRILSYIRTYSEHIRQERNRVQNKLRVLNESPPTNVAIYGAGSHTEFLFRYTEIERVDVICLLDSNPHKWGSTFFGYPIYNPENIKQLDLDAVVISSRAFQDEIFQDIKYLEDNGVDVIRLYDTENSRYPTG